MNTDVYLPPQECIRNKEQEIRWQQTQVNIRYGKYRD